MQQEVLVFGRVGWSLRRIEQRTGVRRENASAYLKAAGSRFGVMVVGDGEKPQASTIDPPTDSTAAKPVNEATTDPGGQIAEAATDLAAVTPRRQCPTHIVRPSQWASVGGATLCPLARPG